MAVETLNDLMDKMYVVERQIMALDKNAPSSTDLDYIAGIMSRSLYMDKFAYLSAVHSIMSEQKVGFRDAMNVVRDNCENT